MSQMTRIGVVGAGRVGAALSAAFRAAGHEIVAAAGESDASRSRIETMLPGVPVMKPTDVARACDLLLLTVPDDMLENVATTLTGAGAIREGQVVVHTSGRHGLGVLAAATAIGARPIAMHPAMTFTGTDLDLTRLGGCVFGITTLPDDRPLAESLVADLGGTPMWVSESKRTLYHAGLAHGANHLVTLVAQAMDLLAASGAVDQKDDRKPRSAIAMMAASPPTAPPRRPSRMKRLWNSRAMKSSSAPTKCSTSTLSRLPAIAPRVAKATASAAAVSTSSTMTKPETMIVLAMADSRLTQSR